MEKTYKRWQKQLDDFDVALKAIPALEQDVRVWGAFAPAVPALFDALIRETLSYRTTAGELRTWMDAHGGGEEQADFSARLRSCIEAARRLKGLIDAFNREKVVAEAAFPELAGGSIKDTPVATTATTPTTGPPVSVETEKAPATHANGASR
jgi:hypothetical protein